MTNRLFAAAAGPHASSPLHQSRSAFVTLLAFAAICVAVSLRFSAWIPTVFYGDDLNYFMEFTRGTCATQAGDILTSVCQERFRPVASSFVIAEMALFGTQVHLYVIVNALIIALTSFVVFLTCLRLSRGRTLSSLLVAIAVATSRFAAYHFTQTLGPVESLTLLFCVSSLYFYLRLEDGHGKQYRWALWAIASAFLAAFTHERTLVLAAWLVLAFVWSPELRHGSRLKLAGLLLACIAIPVLYVSYKTLVLSTEFMVGTGGTHISIDVNTILLHGKEALLSLFGFNQGPQYLVGSPVTRQWTSAFALAIVLAFSWWALLIIGLSSAWRTSTGIRGRLEALRWPLLIGALIVATLAPTLLTIRLEQRWLMIPFALLMLMPAWSLGAATDHLRPRTARLVALLALSSIVLDTLISRHFGNLFFVSSMRYAAAVKEDLVDSPSPVGDTVALLAGAEHCRWTLGNGAFFAVYAGRPKSLHCFASLDEEAKAELPPATRVYGADAETGLIDLTAESDALRLAEANTAENFIERFPRGRISDETPVSSPSGRGAFVMPWSSRTGMHNTLTVISGYRYSFDDVQIPADGQPQLVFGMGMTYPSATSARATVGVAVPGSESEEVVVQRELTAPGADGTIGFVSGAIPLQRFAGKKVTFSFGVDSPHGSPNGHWIAFSSPRIVVASPQASVPTSGK